MTDRDMQINILAELLENLDDLPFYTYKDEAEYLIDEYGVIVPPYEVGTKVCVIASQTSDNKNLYIFEDIITHYHIGGGCMVMGFDNHLGEPHWNWDKVFLTKEEAEQKLKELKQCDH